MGFLRSSAGHLQSIGLPFLMWDYATRWELFLGFIGGKIVFCAFKHPDLFEVLSSSALRFPNPCTRCLTQERVKVSIRFTDQHWYLTLWLSSSTLSRKVL